MHPDTSTNKPRFEIPMNLHFAMLCPEKLRPKTWLKLRPDASVERYPISLQPKRLRPSMLIKLRPDMLMELHPIAQS